MTALRCVHSSAPASGAEQLLGGEVEQDRAEQRLRDADAAEDEVLPRRLEAGRRAVERDQQHGRERRRLHRHPQDAHVVGEQREQHREDEQLVHAVVEAQPRRRQPAVVLLDAHVGPREERGREADERGERDEEHVERIDEELLASSTSSGPSPITRDGQRGTRRRSVSQARQRRSTRGA